MAVPARRIEAEVSMEARIARLESDTAHIQCDVQDLRQEMKGLRQETKELNEKFDRRFGELSDKIDTTRKELEGKIDARFGELGMKFGELQKALGSINVGRAWDRVWMMLSMAALLGVMARGFKWI
jgi:predicted nuclease with TOPRIM domain